MIFYALEPWGWTDEEYKSARLLAMLHNVNVVKKRDVKKPSAFMRDMTKMVLDEMQSPIIYDEDDEQDKQAMIAQAKKDFGIT